MLKTRISGVGLFLFAALTSFSSAAWALGLGNVTVESYLNQPFKAKVELITRASDDLESISAKLASADDFELIGASLSAIPVPLRFAVVLEEGDAHVLVTSTLPVKDPIIRIIVEVNWASGRMLREYTMFLDPPTVTAAAPTPVIDERQQATATRAPATPVAAEVVETAPAEDREESPSQNTASSSPSPQSDGGEYGPVKSGDTLWRIASNWSGSADVDINKVMVAIQRNNPQAFIDGNINLLKRGEILRLPRMGELDQLSSQEAQQTVLDQNQAVSQSRPAQTAVETPLIDQTAPSSSAESDVVAETRGSQLELVPPSDLNDVDSAYGSVESEDDLNATVAVDSLKAELARKEEELVIEQQQNQYLQDRIAELEGQLDSDADGNVDNEELSQLENRLRDDRLADAADAVEDSDAETEEAEQAPAVETPSTSQVPTVASSPAEESGKGSVWMWLIGGLILIVALVFWFLKRNRDSEYQDYDLAAGQEDTVKEIKDEAEEILKVLDDDEPAADQLDDIDLAEDETAESNNGATVVPMPERPAPPRVEGAIDDAELLDEDSVDPEVRLDLARAYISMGDREAARVILEEVIEHGDDKQKTEAESMLKEF